jgi:hypothetical protein
MPWDELHAFWADSVHGPWTAHPRNPVVTDVRSARGAGRPFLVGGDLVRPAQDCSVGYGARTVLNRIVRLTEDEYEERAVGEIVPRRSTGNRRTHTYCADGGLVVVDGMRRRLRSPLASARLATLRAGPAPVEVRCADPDLAAAIAGGPAPRAAPATGARRA